VDVQGKGALPFSEELKAGECRTLAHG